MCKTNARYKYGTFSKHHACFVCQIIWLFWWKDGCFDHDTDYLGNDLNGGDLKTANAKECQTACAKVDSCVEFTWVGVPLNGNGNYINKCFLKNAYHTVATPYNGLISGLKLCGKLGHKRFTWNIPF